MSGFLKVALLLVLLSAPVAITVFDYYLLKSNPLYYIITFSILTILLVAFFFWILKEKTRWWAKGALLLLAVCMLTIVIENFQNLMSYSHQFYVRQEKMELDRLYKRVVNQPKLRSFIPGYSINFHRFIQGAHDPAKNFNNILTSERLELDSILVIQQDMNRLKLIGVEKQPQFVAFLVGGSRNFKKGILYSENPRNPALEENCLFNKCKIEITPIENNWYSFDTR